MVCREIARNSDVVLLSRDQRRWITVSIAMSQVKQTVSYVPGFAIRGDFIHAHRHFGNRPISRHVDDGLAVPEYLEVGLERKGIEEKRAFVVRCLVRRQIHSKIVDVPLSLDIRLSQKERQRLLECADRLMKRE